MQNYEHLKLKLKRKKINGIANNACYIVISCLLRHKILNSALISRVCS